MTVGELKKALEGLDDDDWVSGEYRISRGPLDVEGEACYLEFCSFRIEDVKQRGKELQHELVLY